MTISNFWSDAVGTFKNSEYHNAEEFIGKRMGVDLSIFMNKFLFTDIDKLASTSIPAYPAPDLLQNIKNIHTNLSRYMTLVYVFDGIAPTDGTHCQPVLVLLPSSWRKLQTT